MRISQGLAYVSMALCAASAGASGSRSSLVLGQEFLGLGSGFKYAQDELAADVYCEVGSSETRAEARLPLPHGATVVAWRAWLTDMTPDGDLSVYLVERCRDTQSPLQLRQRTVDSMVTAGAPGDILVERMLEPAFEVDGAACTYALRADFAAGTGGCTGFSRRIHQVSVAFHATGGVQPPHASSHVEGPAIRPEQGAALFTTTAHAERHCLQASGAAYFTTRMPLPDRAVPLRAHAWIHDSDPVWNAGATFRLRCLDDAGEVTWRNLARLESAAANGLSALSAPVNAGTAVDQRRCSVVVINAIDVGDPCVSEDIRYARMGMDYVIDPIFDDRFDVQAP
jgi:hypothetical protein